MKTKMMEKFKGLKKQKTELLQDISGDGYVDVLIKILIAVGIGIAVFTVLNAIIPGAIETLIQRAINQLTGSLAP